MDIRKLYLIPLNIFEKYASIIYSTLGKMKLLTIFSYLDIRKLYFIPLNIFEKYAFIIYSTLAISLLAALIFLLKRGDNLSNYYSLLSWIPILFMVSLIMLKRPEESIKYSVKSTYMLTNIIFISVILCLVIYLTINYLFFFYFNYELSFDKCFNLSRTILKVLLLFKIVISTMVCIYKDRKKPDDLRAKLIEIFSCLMVLAFFYQVIFVIFSALYLVFDDIELIKLSLEIKHENDSKVKSELIIKDKDKSELIIKDKDKSLNHHFNKNYPIIVEGKGVHLLTEDGRKIFDACSGAVVASIGYGHQEVLDAMHKKNMSGVHYLASSYWKDTDVLKLQKYLVDTTYGKLNKAYLTGSGSDAMEAGLKLARQYYFDQDHETTRKFIISRDHSYHGNTLGTLSVSEFPIRQAPYKDILMDNVRHISSCNPFHQLSDGESMKDFVAKKVDELEKKILEIGPEKIMAFVLEPVSGAALGCVCDPPGYLEGVKNICHKYGILIIFDEVMCGMGRTGTYHAWQDSGVSPDILIVGKGLGAGYHPISAVLVSTKVCMMLKSEQFIHGLTYDAMPTGAVAALKVQQIITDNNLVEHVKEVGDYLGQELKAKLSDHPNVGDIRGRGLFWAIELVNDKETKEPFDSKLGVSKLIVDLAKSPEFNMTFYPGTGTVDGLNGDHVIIAPPFIITEQDVDYIVKVLSAVVEKTFKEINK